MIDKKLITFFVWAIILFICLVIFWKLNQILFGNVPYNSQNYFFLTIQDRKLNKYLNKTFPQADLFEKKIINGIEFFKVKKDGRSIGFAKVIEKDILCSVCTDIKFICGLDILGRVYNVVLINHIDLYGERLNREKEKEFLDQFHGIDINSNLSLHNEIINITGATLSCKYIIEGINQFKNEFETINLQ